MTGEPFAGFQTEIYLGGVGGQLPAFPLRLDELEERARQVLSPEAYDYVAGGAGSEDTMRENLEAFRRWRLVPRMLQDVSVRDLRTEVLGTEMPAPVMLAPIGVQGVVHEEGEVAVARAAASLGIPFVLSTVSSRTLEEVAEAAGDGPRWFQLYWPNDDDLTVSFLDRAKAAGYSAIVVTLDAMMLAWRPRDLQHAYLPFLGGNGIANYTSDPVFRASLAGDDPQQAVLRWVSVFPHPTATWEKLRFVREHADLPLVLKGILDPEDARRAADEGADGVLVSNHGGRQVDGGTATLDALPQVVEAVGDRLPVLLDSGVRTGADAVKAISLGAEAVLLGRPYVWGLALGGEEGVRQVLRAFLADLDLTLGLTGRTRPAELGPSMLARA